MTRHTFTVPGVAQPKGSMRSFAHAKTGRIVTMSDNPKLGSWEGRVALAAQAAGVRPHPGAVVVNVECALPRPKGHAGKRGLKPSAPAWHTQKPDADKLLRAVLDGLTGIAFADDSQVVTANCRKRWADLGEQAGARVSIWLCESESMPPKRKGAA